MSLKRIAVTATVALLISTATQNFARAQGYPQSTQQSFAPTGSATIGRAENGDLRRVLGEETVTPVTTGTETVTGTGKTSCAPGAGGCCDTPSCEPECCTPCCRRHRCAVFGDLLLLSATNVDLPYALPASGLGPVNVLNGPAATAESQYETGFRVGANYAFDDCNSLMGTFWHFDSSDRDQESLPGTGGSFFRALLTDPGTQNVAADSLATRSRYDIDFTMIDLVWKKAIYRNESTLVNAVVGARYAHLSQDLVATYQILGTTTVDMDTDFHGIGPRLGIDADSVSSSGFLVYGNAHANFLVGVFESDYRQNNVFAGAQSFTSYEDSRFITQLELELGVGWQSCCGKYRITAGYYMAGWFNAVTVPALVRGVQRRQLEDLDDTIGFNGLTVRAMIQF